MSTPEERTVIEHSLEAHQRELRVAFEELKQAARTVANPRHPIREHPARWLTIGVAVGLWLGWRE